MADEKTALFVRIPMATAKKLESHAKRAGKSKQDVVSTLITEGLQKGIAPSLVVPTAPTVSGPEAVSDIMTLDELVAFLRVDRSELERRLQAQELPARRFGDEWRFSREAIAHWMEGTDRPTKRQTGFSRNP
jgi:excisionase family DNA binding protein